jgi:hypothetical protein
MGGSWSSLSMPPVSARASHGLHPGLAELLSHKSTWPELHGIDWLITTYASHGLCWGLTELLSYKIRMACAARD